MDNYRIELGRKVEQKINQAINDMLPQFIFQEPNKLKLYIPKMAMDYLNEYLKSISTFTYSDKKGVVNKYKGYEIIEGYELAIVFVHSDYVLYRQGMVKVDLSNQ